MVNRLQIADQKAAEPISYERNARAHDITFVLGS